MPAVRRPRLPRRREGAAAAARADVRGTGRGEVVNGAGGEFRERYGRVEGLVRALEALPDTAAREAARELTRALFDLHAAGLRRVLELSDADAVARLAADPTTSGLLLLHGLHPLPAAERVARALDRLRPQFHGVGGDIELVSASEETVRLRLRGRPESGRTLRGLANELVVDAVPDVAVIELEEAWDRDPSGRVPLPLVGTAGGPR
ncbi:MAG: NifU family protein [Isosphaera sp.]|nr:NifU family protein [Isosphaera sp.]